MAYSSEEKQKALNLIKAGVPITEVALDLNINRGTLNNWVKKSNDADVNLESIENIKTQISTLSKRAPTEATAKKLAMLTKSLDRLQKKSKKIEKKKAKPSIIQNKEVAAYKARMLEDDYGLYNYQKEFIRDESRFRVWLKSRQIGATYGCAGECLVDAMSGMDQLILSASETQALKWHGEIHKHAQKLGIALSGSTSEIKTPSGATIYIFANNFRTIQGFSGSVWMDEFAWYLNPKRIWEAFIPSITSVKAGETKARITILSTPFEQDSLFHKLVLDELKYYMFSRHKTTIYDAVKEGLDVDIKVLRDLFDEDSWATMYECQFVDDDSSFFPISLIKSCVKDYNYYTPNVQSILWSGYDIGRVKDLSVLSCLDKVEHRYVLAIQDVYKKASFESQKTILRDHLNVYLKSNMRIDRTGIGMDLAEGMEGKYPNRVEGVYFTASSKEMMVLNLKKMLEDKIITLPNDPVLIADIHAIKRKAGQKRMLYDADRNVHGHADRFWSLALAAKKIDVLDRGEGGESKGGAVIL
jgi:phage FluMu gp28-like protein/transposase-like protein